MKKIYLSEFEEVVILTVGVLFQEAYGVAIKKEMEARLKRTISVGALHTALRRLEEKGFVKSHDGDTTEDRQGRPRKYYQITAYGRKAIEQTKDTRDGLWKDMPKMALNLKFS